ncbi:MAG: pilin [Caldimicrobium sp.]
MKNIRIKGFTLIELLIVIGILALLASFALPIYLRYQEKSKISSYVLPMVKACAYDALAFCMSERAADATNVTMEVTSLPNCKKATQVASYSLKITITGTFTCEASGHISNGTVTGELNGIDLYKAQCILNNESIHCQILPKL